VRNSSDVTKHASIPYWEAHIDREVVKCFIKAVMILASPTGADIKSYLEMRLGGDTDPNAMDNRLRAYYENRSEKISEK